MSTATLFSSGNGTHRRNGRNGHANGKATPSKIGKSSHHKRSPKPAKAKAREITAHDVRRYLALEERRKSLQRQARDLDKQAEEIEEQMIAFVGGPGRTVRLGKYELAIEFVNGKPAWKAEFIRVAGEDAAEIVIATVPQRQSLTINSL